MENAERQLAEERAAEERRTAEEVVELVRRERERVERVERYFEHLRQVLDSVKEQQRGAIEARHQASLEMVQQLEQRCENVVAARQAEIRDERKRLIREGKEAIEDLQRRHAHAVMQTMARHRAHQDQLLNMDVSHRVSRDSCQVAQQSEVLKAAMLEALLPTQELERAELKAQQGREIKKWKIRAGRAVKDFDVEKLCLEVRTEEVAKVRGMMAEAQRREECDWKWFESIFEERFEMLGEDVGRVVRSGGDVPALVMTPPEREPPKVPGEGSEGSNLVVEVQGVKAATCNDTSDEDLSEYVRMRGWSGTPNFGLGMGIGVGRRIAVGGY